ncbi:BRCA1-A complex subunit RAP80 isoform X5 [Rana temporaria]|uniref:BRCA1-A complex subunit RAP80 isoform X5 n=1 Tax=Rana temporaria TaxID=8407 RepID=UPI001AAD1C35|nr:BRCA1-A complex subunit RAP80 isoform X5 [Rana temporaria]
MHPLRKRKVRPDDTCSQYGTEEDEGSTSEPRNKAGPANRIDEKEEKSIVISDSDSLELEEDGNSQKKVAIHRKTLSVKRKIARMTEEEQLALAVKISQQEQANHVKHRQEEEEELLRKAIEESLHEPRTEMLPSECEEVAPEVIVESPILPADVRDENGVNSEMPIENTQEESVCPETQLSSEIQDNDQENQPDLTETSPESSQACCLNSPPPELMACEEPISSLDVECPMCGCRFSQTQIERHAAYCDGTKDEPPMTVLRPRNRPSRHMYNGSHDSVPSSDSGRLEKCYLCKSLVPIKDYQTHVDKCLQSAAQETQGTQMLKGSKETEREGRLLNMLEQSESISADENYIALDFSGMSPPREEHAGSFGSSHLSINDSPIRSFVSISEAKDCLVDFKKQLSRPKYQPSKKRPQHRGKRRRM